MSNKAEIEELIIELREGQRALETQVAQAQEATVRLRAARVEIKELLDKEVPRIVAEAVAFHISRSNLESRRNR